MKNTFKILLIVGLSSLIFVSCNNSIEQNNSNNDEGQDQQDSGQKYTGEKLVITDKIMYDVTVVNDIIGDRSKNCPDWFWENLPTPESDEFIKSLLIDAVSGKLKTYYYDMTGDYESFDEILIADLKPYMDEILAYEIEVVDTTVKRFKPEQVTVNLDYRNVKKLRFLEEWYIADGVFHKEVIAIAPYFTIEYPGMETVHAVYFWIMINK